MGAYSDTPRVGSGPMGPNVSSHEGDPQVLSLEHECYFSRLIYAGVTDDDFGPHWAVDYPKADQQFLIALERLSGTDSFNAEHALRMDLERLFDFPFWSRHRKLRQAQSTACYKRWTHCLPVRPVASC